MAKFKAGDRVYCPEKGGSVFVVIETTNINASLKKIIDDGHLYIVNLNNLHHATPENKQALETLYGMEFEAV